MKYIKQINSAEEYLQWNSRAIGNMIIWPDYSLFTKTEIWKKADKIEYEGLRNALLNIAEEA